MQDSTYDARIIAREKHLAKEVETIRAKEQQLAARAKVADATGPNVGDYGRVLALRAKANDAREAANEAWSTLLDTWAVELEHPTALALRGRLIRALGECGLTADAVDNVVASVFEEPPPLDETVPPWAEESVETSVEVVIAPPEQSTAPQYDPLPLAAGLESIDTREPPGAPSEPVTVDPLVPEFADGLESVDDLDPDALESSGDQASEPSPSDSLLDDDALERALVAASQDPDAPDVAGLEPDDAEPEPPVVELPFGMESPDAALDAAFEIGELALDEMPSIPPGAAIPDQQAPAPHEVDVAQLGSARLDSADDSVESPMPAFEASIPAEENGLGDKLDVVDDDSPDKVEVVADEALEAVLSAEVVRSDSQSGPLPRPLSPVPSELPFDLEEDSMDVTSMVQKQSPDDDESLDDSLIEFGDPLGGPLTGEDQQVEAMVAQLERALESEPISPVDDPWGDAATDIALETIEPLSDAVAFEDPQPTFEADLESSIEGADEEIELDDAPSDPSAPPEPELAEFDLDRASAPDSEPVEKPTASPIRSGSEIVALSVDPPAGSVEIPPDDADFDFVGDAEFDLLPPDDQEDEAPSPAAAQAPDLVVVSDEFTPPPGFESFESKSDASNFEAFDSPEDFDDEFEVDPRLEPVEHGAFGDNAVDDDEFEDEADAGFDLVLPEDSVAVEADDDKLSAGPVWTNAPGAERGPESWTERHPRAPLAVKIGLQFEGQFFAGFTASISAGGIFISTHQALTPSSVVDLFFEVPGGYSIATKAEVRWTRDAGDEEVGQSRGLGLAFQDLAPSDRAIIDRFVKRHLGSSAQLPAESMER